MTLDQLAMLEAILETGSFQGAAKRLHKSQPSISVGIKKIEDEYGVILFSRETYRPTLTDQGRTLYKSALTVLKSFRAFERKARQLSLGVEAQLVIAVDPIADLTPLQAGLNRIIKDDIATEISIRTGIMYDNAEAVLQGAADIGIGLLPDHKISEWESRPYSEARLVPCISKTLFEGTITLAALSLVPQIVVMANKPANAITEGRQWFVSNHDQKEQLVLRGLGWGRVCHRFWEMHRRDLQFIDPTVVGELPLNYALFRHPDRPLGPVGQKLWEDTLAYLEVPHLP